MKMRAVGQPAIIRLSERLLRRILEAQDGVAALLHEWAESESTDRRAPVDPQIMQQAALQLDEVRRILSRHPLVVEIPPLAAEPPVMAGDLFVRLLRANRALRLFLAESDVSAIFGAHDQPSDWPGT